MDSDTLLLEQIDRALGQAREAKLPGPPRGGWLRSIREALGMTTRQLARRAGMSLTALQTAERNEATGAIGLAQLKRVAAALDCEVRYVLVPRAPLKTVLQARADALARAQVESVAHSMSLEAQSTDTAFVERQIAELRDELLRGRRSKLWETPAKP